MGGRENQYYSAKGKEIFGSQEGGIPLVVLYAGDERKRGESHDSIFACCREKKRKFCLRL